jgi:Transposase DDE domain group 1
MNAHHARSCWISTTPTFRCTASKRDGSSTALIKEYCYLPFYVFCGRHLLLARQRRANVAGSDGAVEEIARIVARIRQEWPRAHHSPHRQRLLQRRADGMVRGKPRRLRVWPSAQSPPGGSTGRSACRGEASLCRLGATGACSATFSIARSSAALIDSHYGKPSVIRSRVPQPRSAAGQPDRSYC